MLREGKGAILRKGNDVFYNPAQARSVISTVQRLPRLLEAPVHLPHATVCLGAVALTANDGGTADEPAHPAPVNP